ncbi:MAG: S9 family peptidase, partial [Pseudomonadota bacterium]
MPTERYDAATFFNSTSYALPSAFQWSPDDRYLYLSSNQTGVFNAYRMDVASGDLEAMTESTDDGCYASSGFPSDGRLLFRSDRGGNERQHLYVRAEDGKVTDLTPGDDVSASFFGWSNDHQHFYVLSNARDPQAFDVYQYHADTYESELIFQNDNAYMPSAYDGERFLALSKSYNNSNSDVLVHDMLGNQGEPTLITSHDGDIEHTVYSFDRKGKLVYSTNEHGEWMQAWAHDLETGEQSLLVEADWNVGSVGFSPSGRYRVTMVNADSRSELSFYDTEKDVPLLLPNLPIGDIDSIVLSRDESKMAVAISSDTSPSDIY